MSEETPPNYTLRSSEQLKRLIREFLPTRALSRDDLKLNYTFHINEHEEVRILEYYLETAPDSPSEGIRIFDRRFRSGTVDVHGHVHAMSTAAPWRYVILNFIQGAWVVTRMTGERPFANKLSLADTAGVLTHLENTMVRQELIQNLLDASPAPRVVSSVEGLAEMVHGAFNGVLSRRGYYDRTPKVLDIII